MIPEITALLGTSSARCVYLRRLMATQYSFKHHAPRLGDTSKQNIYPLVPERIQLPSKMAGYISFDAQKFWAVPNAKPLKSNLQAILDTSPHLEYCRNIPGCLSTTQDISSMLPGQGGYLTNRLLDDMDIISSEGGDKDSHDHNTNIGDENIAGMRPFRSDIGSLSPDDYSSQSNAKAAMRSDYKKRTGNTGKQCRERS